MKSLKNIINKSLRVLTSSTFLLTGSYFLTNKTYAKSFKERFEDKVDKSSIKKYNNKKFMNLDILVDEEFIEKYGENWRNKAKWFMKESERYFHEFDIYFNIKSYKRYETSDNGIVDDLFGDLRDKWRYMCDKGNKCQFEPSNPFFIFLLSNQDYEGMEGESGPFYGIYNKITKLMGGVGFASLTEDINSDDKATVGVIAHEIGHMLGADHIKEGKDGLILGIFPVFYIMYPMITINKNMWHPANKKIINKHKKDLTFRCCETD